MYEQRPQDADVVIWIDFVEWFLQIPDVDETLVLPDAQGCFDGNMLLCLAGFVAGYERGLEEGQDQGPEY